MEYWCKFLVEVVTGVAATDHIDLEGVGPATLSLTLRIMAPVIGVDEEEARRRLGLPRDGSAGE
jgi:hypothetical protein